MSEASKMKWQQAAEGICQVAEGLISSTVRKAADDIYASVMETVQDYLRENVEFNLSSKLQGYADTANRLRSENEQLKRRADIAEQMAEALELCAAALQMLPMSERDVLKFTGKWKHYGSMRVGDILDRADAILKARQASNGDRHGEKGE
jgi:hypothetical protein